MRKRRLARLGGAKWTPHPSAPVDWLLLEKALGHKLADTQRDEISMLVADYLMFEGMERAAPFQSDEQAWLTKLAAAAAELHRVLVIRPMHEQAARQGLVEVEIMFARIIRDAFGSTGLSLENVACFLGPAIDAVARRDAAEGIIEGERWRHLVAGLAMKFKQWGLPTGIRKDSDKRASGDSPFVAFFAALQSVFPEESRRHQHSSVALAKAMSNALRDVKLPKPAP
jgi:hypothetical protein